MLYLFKGRFQKIIRWIGGDWMTANMATLGGCLFVVLTSACFFHGLSGAPLLLLAVPFCLLFRLVMNALDGMLAREHGTGSVAGEIWNEALDVLGDTLCYGVLFFVTGGPRISLVLFSFGHLGCGILWRDGPRNARRRPQARNVLWGKTRPGHMDGMPGFDRILQAWVLRIHPLIPFGRIRFRGSHIGSPHSEDHRGGKRT